MDDLIARSPGGLETPAIRTVKASRPWHWLARGWRDLRRAGFASLFYGFALAFVGALVVWLAGGRPYLVTVLYSGFFLIAPFLLIGVYDLSRQLEHGAAPDPGRAFSAWRANADSIGLFGLGLAFVLISWERISAILFALLYGGEVSSVETLVHQMAFSADYRALLVAYVGIGGLLAVFVFAISAVSVPMLLDRNADVATAIATSLRAVARNPVPMAIWAVLIVVLTAIGFATYFLGLIVVLPWLGHATWHAYRDLVE